MALQAHPVNFGSLTANLERNERINVDARHAPGTLWPEPGEVEFVEGPHGGAGSILGGGGRTFAVQAETLDSIVAGTGRSIC